ncbi:MAG: hypothetical protein JHC81_05115 [Brevundimonas sp.]|uniref:hypothetical protein n=1 Tax=Brevundimonas sp. TaxID=1871086 RepID=UPI001A2ACAD2|nr:hypothetical protein [Brevundimonas sp.]MBJ7446895.1 hypothetical protein [Brevundimonas sp.]
MSLKIPRVDHRLFRLAAVAAGLIVGWFAFRPAMEAEGGLPWDKANHALAFLILTVLTGLGWSRMSWPWLMGLMLMSGVGVELIQGLEEIGRDADAMDVVADGVGILAGLAILRVQGINGSRAA